MGTLNSVRRKWGSPSLPCSSLYSSLASYWLLEEMLRLMTDLMLWLMIGGTLQCDDANNFVGDLGGSLKESPAPSLAENILAHSSHGELQNWSWKTSLAVI